MTIISSEKKCASYRHHYTYLPKILSPVTIHPQGNLKVGLYITSIGKGENYKKPRYKLIQSKIVRVDTIVSGNIRFFINN